MIRAALLALLIICFPASSSAQFAPTGTGGIGSLNLALRQLGHVKRILVIAAHPDDEDTSLLTVMAREAGAQAAYLALSRGEGGQNLIGPELGLDLGVLRSEELLAARARDGARQYFTRAFDFGFSKSVEETHTLWPRDSLLKDVIRIVRRFRPQVIVTVFSGTSRDGHGQHQAAGLAARDAYRLAGDPTVFPELETDEGLQPHTPVKLYRSARFDPAVATLRLPAGVLDPVTGRSYYQIAMESRSQHRSQDMGGLQPAGPRSISLQLLEDRAGTGDELFAGIDTTLRAQFPAVGDHLDRFQDGVVSARHALNPYDVHEVALRLQEALGHLRAAIDGVASTHPAAVLLDEQERLATAALLGAAGVAVDATVDDSRLVPGQAVEVEVEVWNAGVLPLLVERVEIDGAAAGEPLAGGSVEPGELWQDEYHARLSPDAALTRPYFTQRPRAGALYDWSDAGPAVRGEPFGPPPLMATFALRLAGTPVVTTREVVHRYRDQAVGEIREPVQVVAAVSVALTPEQLVWATSDAQPRNVVVTLTNGRNGMSRGEVGIEVPDGWPSVAPAPFALETPDQSVTMSFSLSLPSDVAPGRYEIRAKAILEDGSTERMGPRVVRYAHTRPRFLVREATSTVHAVDIHLPRLSRVGYVRGASDEVPEALRAIGVPVELLGEDELAGGDLSAYDVIVVGSRAYETSTALREHNARLLDYGREGGTVIVQYQQYQFARGGFAPYPIEFSRPHDRITDEEAPPTLLDPSHPAFTTPNRIRPEDWDDWVQERGLYFGGEWSDEYMPLLAFSDPGEPPKRGGLLVAPLGRGIYVYTGLSFFRELPSGVPGAYRLLVNLLGLRSRDVF